MTNIQYKYLHMCYRVLQSFVYLRSELVALCSDQQAYGSKRLYSVLSSSEDDECEGDKIVFITQCRLN